MKFKIGDIVTCVDNSNTALIKRGHNYKVIGCKTTYEGHPAIIVNDNHVMYEWRFELAKEYLFDSLYLRLK